MAIDFREPQLRDRDLIDHYYRSVESKSCEDCFVNLYLWKHMYPTEFAIVDDMMVIRSPGEHHSYRFPKGPKENAKGVLEKMMEHAAGEGREFRMIVITPEEFAMLEEMFPGKFKIEYERDIADYVYEREKLASLSGKKYHGQKNHVNKFLRTYPDWQYEKITDDNVEECFQMALKWRDTQGYDDTVDAELHTELGVTMNELRLMKELHLTGGALRVNGEIVAFTIGEPLCSDTFVAHVEKARTDIEGAYTMIMQQFVLHEMDGFTYVNREDDTGDEGLRQAKEALHPAMMIQKGLVTLA